MNLSEKQEIVQQMHEKFTDAKIVIVTDYKGLDVESMTALRGKLREAGSEYKVVKNTLLRRAAQDTDVAPVVDYFKGPTAIAFSTEEPVGPAKALTDFVKGNDKLEIKAGVMDGKLLDVKDIKALSELPSKDVLLGQLLSVMNAVPTSLVRLLNAVPQQMMNVLQALADQKNDAA